MCEEKKEETNPRWKIYLIVPQFLYLFRSYSKNSRVELNPMTITAGCAVSTLNLHVEVLKPWYFRLRLYLKKGSLKQQLSYNEVVRRDSNSIRPES